MPATPAWPPRSAPRLFIEQKLDEGISVSIEGNQAHYLSKVMRVSPGDSVILCDDQSGEWAASVEASGRRSVELTISRLLRRREQVPDFWLCAALLKKDRFDLVLEKATELGVRRIAPLVTRRCVADKLNADRAKSIIVEAAEQCARTALPELSRTVKFAEFVKEFPANRTLFFADENGGIDAAKAFSQTAGSAALITGPEGGFDYAEREMLLACPNVKPITLGPRILRGETAALAAISLWMGIAGDWRNEGKSDEQ
ncbi:16S rRNA (uracil(1498)-N(3))-methyltransferase [Pontixanthobacter gangjinensis]|uniref:Ribosomal RNA small subunit methyltransferase E n=1 Tax=Pontixanthobacter gangjinensis TaxID=1028742 RepID=A0A6I4SP39_9SPHN|nr:16S rRNA (uracil(1498)-N(3))-methyltransferase [Pontixanthobacter gangjinensis]MXO57409.1 16S rRNA (uracil(1498)-N(3))-methyltransferase [Pontixanthobacter gangjinensis]